MCGLIFDVLDLLIHWLDSMLDLYDIIVLRQTVRVILTCAMQKEEGPPDIISKSGAQQDLIWGLISQLQSASGLRKPKILKRQ